MVDLSNDEFTVLQIAATGQSMMQVGRWQQPTEHLVELGLLKQHDRFNCVITPAGCDAVRVHEKKIDDTSLRIGAEVHQLRIKTREVLEQAAAQLAEAARLGQRVSGGDIDGHVEMAAFEIIKRAKELVR